MKKTHAASRNVIRPNNAYLQPLVASVAAFSVVRRGEKRNEVHDYTNRGNVEAGKAVGWQAISCTKRLRGFPPTIWIIPSSVLHTR